MDAQPPNLPPEALAAVRAYLALKVERPSRSRLYPEGFEEYGPSLNGLASCVHPLIFDTGIEGAEYGIAGTCFLAKYRGQIFVITAGHCLAAGDGNDLRIALNAATKSFLPLRQMHRARSNPPNQDFADVAILEATPELLSTDEQRGLFALDLDQLLTAEMLLKTGAKLVVPGFPKCLNEVDYDRFVIHTQRYLPSGNYLSPTERKGVHLMSLDEMEKVESGDGMSGSPVLFVEEHPEAHYFGFLGMVIKGSKFWLQKEFIAAPVIYQMLDQTIRENASGKPASAPA